MFYIRTAAFILSIYIIFKYDILWASTCDSLEPSWIFCEDFESGELNNWDELNRTFDQYKTIIKETGPSGRTENHVFRLRIPPTQKGNGINKTFNPDEYDTLYARWYILYESGFDFTARNHGHGLHGGDRWKKGMAGHRPQGNDWFTAQVEYLPISNSNSAPRSYIYAYYRGMSMDCTVQEGSCWGDNIPCMISDYYCNRIPSLKEKSIPPLLKHEVWYCVEIMLDAGDPVESNNEANGRLNLWVNNLEIGPWENMWFRTTSSVRINHFWLGLFHHEEHSIEGIKFDDVIVSTNRIGCKS